MYFTDQFQVFLKNKLTLITLIVTLVVMKTPKPGKKTSYHHGNLAESLLNAVDEIAGKFGLEAVTLRACAKRVGVSPSSAFRHYTDKRALLTAFAARALNQLSEALALARESSAKQQDDAFQAIGIAYVAFAIDNPAFFRAMWREETIYGNDPDYIAAAARLSSYLKGGFGDTLDDDDPNELSAEELLAWSSVHGLAELFVDGPVGRDESREQKLNRTRDMLKLMAPLVG